MEPLRRSPRSATGPDRPEAARPRSAPAAGRRRRPAAATSLQRRRVGSLSLLLPPLAPPASPLSQCLDQLQEQWRRQGNQEAALWQAWPRIAGPQLAPHCRPLQLLGDRLVIGAAPGPWLQALTYNRHQLLGALRGAGFAVRELQVRQFHATALPPSGGALEQEAWALHPSRVDVHGLAECPLCHRPAPTGEMARWGHCSFCRRQELAAAMAPPLEPG